MYKESARQQNVQNVNFGHKIYRQHQSFTLWLLSLYTMIAIMLQMPQYCSGGVLPTDNLWNIVTDAPNNHLENFLHLHGQGHEKRLRKRHNHYLYFKKYAQENTDAVWVNPCGGVYNIPELSMSMERDMSNEQEVEIMSNVRMRRLKSKPYLRFLRRSIRDQYTTLRQTHKAIDISKFEQWSKWESQYEFLPNIRVNSTLKLRKWYRHMQKYVAAFAHLGSAQYQWDVEHQLESEITHELYELLLSARSILCEIETTINGSHTINGINLKHKLPVYSRAVMSEQLKFPVQNSLFEVPQVDLVYVKKYYFDYLETMSHVLFKSLRHLNLKSIRHSNSKEQLAQQLHKDLTSEEVMRSFNSMMESDYSAEKSNLE